MRYRRLKFVTAAIIVIVASACVGVSMARIFLFPAQAQPSHASTWLIPADRSDPRS